MTAGIAAQLRVLRLEQGLPLKVVAARLGVSLWHLSRLEHERRRTVEQIERWAHALGADVTVAVVAIPAKARPRKSRAA
jgi:transcriptional regulator with XRE-family HTH domain